MLLRDVFADHSVRTTELWIAIDSTWLQRVGAPDIRISRETFREKTRRGVKSVEVLRRKQKVFVIAGLRRNGQLRRHCIIGVEFQRIIFRAIGWIDQGLDHAKISGLRLARIGIDIVEICVGIYKFTQCNERYDLAVRRLKSGVR